MWTILRLNILIWSYHLGRVENVAPRAISLVRRLPRAAIVTCFGLAIASAYKTGDIANARKLACAMAKDIHTAWDLPTIPRCVIGTTRKVIVLEVGSVAPMLEVIEALKRAPDNTQEEASLLEVLAARYKARRIA